MFYKITNLVNGKFYIGKRLGENNPQFGKFWITNGEVNKLIRPSQFEEFQKNGFVRGRTIRVHGEIGSTQQA